MPWATLGEIVCLNVAVVSVHFVDRQMIHVQTKVENSIHADEALILVEPDAALLSLGSLLRR